MPVRLPPPEIATRELFPLVDVLPLWMSERQAAFVLGLTPAEVRSRVREKSLTGRPINPKRGRCVFVTSESVRMAYHAQRVVRAA